MNLAEQLISDFITEKLVQGKVLSGAEVASLRSKQHVFIHGMRATVLDSVRQGSNVELTYMTGTKLYGPDKYLVVPFNASTTPVQAASEVVEGYKITRGMKRAYEKVGKLVCTSCGLTVPRYPGRYPAKCPHCNGKLEDLQNSPTYSEARRKRKESNRDRRAMNSQVRMVKRDRIPG